MLKYLSDQTNFNNTSFFFSDALIWHQNQTPLFTSNTNFSLTPTEMKASRTNTSSNTTSYDTSGRFCDILLDSPGSWIPLETTTNNGSPYVILDLSSKQSISGIVTQGRGDNMPDDCVPTYNFYYSNDNNTWTSIISNEAKSTTFIGNTLTTQTSVQNTFPTITARYFKVIPLTLCAISFSMRLDLLYYPKNTPSSTKNTPSSRQNTPSSTKNIPSSTKNIPSSTKNIPSSTKNTPSSRQNTPSSTKNTTSSTKNTTSPNSQITTSSASSKVSYKIEIVTSIIIILFIILFFGFIMYKNKYSKK